MVYSYANSASVSIMNVRSYSGELRYVYFETANGAIGTAPSINTALSPSATTGSYTIKKGSSAYLWSTPFANSATINPLTWTVVIYSSCSKSSTVQISLETTDSTGVVQSSLISNAVTSTIGTSESEIVLSVVGSSGSVPVNGYVGVIVNVPKTGPSFCTVYWGAGQQTNFQMAYLLTA